MSVTCFTSLAHKLSSHFSVAHIVLVMRTGGRAAPFRKEASNTTMSGCVTTQLVDGGVNNAHPRQLCQVL